MCLNVLREVKEDPKEVPAVKVLVVAKDVREQAAVTATDNASKPSATRPKITCCNASANPTPVSTSQTNKVPVVTEALAVPEVPEVLVVLVVPAAEDSEVVIMTDLTQAAQAALAVPEAKDSEEANSSFSKLARTTKPMPIKPRPVCLTHS